MDPPFIAGQRLWKLVAPREFVQQCLRPEWLWTLPRDEDSAGRRSIEIPGAAHGSCFWQLINPGPGHGDGPQKTAGQQRREFLADRSIRRLCVTIDAGVGKTTALRQTALLRQTDGENGCLALMVDFAELPGKVGRMLDFLVGKLQNIPALRDQPDSRLLALIQRCIRQNRFSLIVDSLDQSASVKKPENACRALQEFLDRYPEVCCVVSGRPFAVRRYWDLLFQPDAPRPGNDAWQFVKVDVFTKQEAGQYVGPDRVAHLGRLGADVIAIPRSLEMIQRIPDEGLAGLRTKSDVYYLSLEGMLRKALHKQPLEVGLSEAASWKLFSLVAFEMLRGGYGAGHKAGIEAGENRHKFTTTIWQRHFSILQEPPLYIGNAKELDRELGKLLAVNEHLVDPVLAGRDSPAIVHFFWRNQSLMDMFAALWITRYAQQDGDYRWFQEQLGEQASHELCQLAVEMPLLRDGTGQAGLNEAYVRMMSAILDDDSLASKPTGTSLFRRIVALFMRPRQTKYPKRWTEWIYRGWPNLLQAAGYLMHTDWSESDLQQATAEASRDAQSAVENGRALDDPNRPGRAVLLRFLGEFQRNLAGTRGKAAQKTAEAMNRSLGSFDGRVRSSTKSGFRPIPGGTFRKHWEDDEPEVSIAPFEMAATTVTNAQWKLFDRDPRDIWTSAPKVPVSAVTWYDAWCFAVWAGCWLPAEEQWEYACRAGSTGEFCFGDDARRLGDYAWYDQNVSLGTRPVGEKLPNAWGLYDTHGNVSEWCNSWFEQGGSYRVYRGGSWRHRSEHCRASYRGREAPASWGRAERGFRLARTVSSPSR
jgi:hypothetical protein